MTMEQQITAINMQLQASQEQVTTLSKAVDSVRQEASDAVLGLRAQLAHEQATTQQLQDALARHPGSGGGGSSREMSAVNTKEFSGGKFSGAKNENFKVWSRKVRIFCNAQKHGFRKALEGLENNEEVEVNARVINEMAWEHAQTADAKLADFLAT